MMVSFNPFKWFRKGAEVFAAVTPNSADIPENDRYWRRAGSSSRNLNEHDQQRMNEDCVRSYQRHGLARSAIRIKTGFVVGSVPTVPQVVCDDEGLRERIEEHVLAVWEDTRNRCEERTRKWCDSLSINGELFVPVHPDKASRHTLFGFIDPCTVTSVICDPLDAQTPIGALRQDGMAKCYVHPILGEDGFKHAWFTGKGVGDTVTLPNFGVAGGDREATVQPDCFHLAINDIPGMSRGISDLFPVLDLLDLHERMTFSAAERAENMASFTWAFKADATTSDDAIVEVAKSIRQKVEDGTGNVVAFKGGELEAVAPNIQAADWESMTKTVLRHILSGLIYPESWFDSAATTFAAAGDGASPALTALQERQSLYRCWLEGMLTYVAMQLPAARAAIARDRKAWRIELPLPVIVGKDTMRESAVLTSDLNALMAAESEGYITKEAAQRFAAETLTAYGFTIQPGDQPDPDEFEEDKLRRMPFPIMAPTNQTQPNEPGKEGGRGEDEDHREAA